MHCPATAETREQYTDVIYYYQHLGSNIFDPPVSFRNQLDDYFHLVQHQHEEPVLDPALQMQLACRQAAGFRLRAFTDGSCQHPETPQCSFAAHAAVLDLCETDDMRLEVVADFRRTQRMPSNFAPVFLGRTPGEQRIYRSEIFCIVKVCETLTCADIFTDSQSSLDVVARCQLASKVEELIYLEDYDMVERLWFALQKGSFHFYKIDAHQNPVDTYDDHLCFNRLGNMKADELSVTACWNLCPRLVAEYEAIFHETKTSMDMLLQWYKLLLEHQTTRAKLVSVANA